VASAASACGSLNFFPTAAQITGAPAASASVAVTSNVTCTGNNVCNWPPVLSKAAQEANLTALGTSISADGLLTVAVKEYGSKQLRFFFSPSSPLLTANANAQACVQATLPAAARRRLQAATYTVTSAGSWSYSVAFNTGGSVNGGDKAAGEVGDATLTVENTPDVSGVCTRVGWARRHAWLWWGRGRPRRATPRMRAMPPSARAHAPALTCHMHTHTHTPPTWP
jgi:hypothetical protein